MEGRWRASSSCHALLALVLALQCAQVLEAGYTYNRCGNNTLVDKVHQKIPDPKNLGSLTSCSMDNNKYTSSYCIAAAVLIVVGTFFCFFGSRFFRVILFFVGLVVAGGLVFFLLFNHLPCETPEFSWVVIGTAGAVGLLAGFATLCLYTVGIFAIGATAGALLMLSFLSVLNNAYVETHQWLPIVLTIVLALIFGILALKLEERFVAIPCTAFIGAILATYGLDYYVENAAAVQYTWLLLEGKSPHLKCVQTWVMLTAVWPLLLISGFLVQCFKTGKKNGDEEDGSWKSRKGRRWGRGDREERGELLKDVGY